MTCRAKTASAAVSSTAATSLEVTEVLNCVVSDVIALSKTAPACKTRGHVFFIGGGGRTRAVAI